MEEKYYIKFSGIFLLAAVANDVGCNSRNERSRGYIQNLRFNRTISGMDERHDLPTFKPEN